MPSFSAWSYSAVSCTFLPPLNIAALQTDYPSFQEVQGLSALQTSIRFLPGKFSSGVLISETYVDYRQLCIGIVIGIATNFTTGVFINKIPAIYVVLGSSVLCSASPLLMALIDPHWPFWYNAFFAQVRL